MYRNRLSSASITIYRRGGRLRRLYWWLRGRRDDQAYFWTREWQDKERQAAADFATDRASRSVNAETLIAALHEATRCQP